MDMLFEKPYWQKFQYLCGVDEVGRGPLAGPVVAAAVIFDRNFVPDTALKKVADSKALRPKDREVLSHEIKKRALSFAVAEITPEIIDKVNILQATFLAMTQAIEGLSPMPEFLLIDGNRFKTSLEIPFETIVKGDSRVFSIAAASIIAKVHRDNLMLELDKTYPEYGFGQHFGYPTKQHIEAVRKFGRSAVHRKSFKLAVLGEK